MTSLKTNVERLEEAKLKISNKEEYIEFLSFCKKFYNKEFENQLLIYSQNKYATIVKSFLEWKFAGRKTKKQPKTIYLCKDYKLKQKNFIDGQVDINGKEKKQRKNNKLEVIGNKTIERTCGYDISDTLIDRKSNYKFQTLRLEEISIDKEEFYNLIKSLWSKNENNILDIDDDIIYRIRKLCDYILEEDECNLINEYYNLFLDSITYLVVNYFGFNINNKLEFKEYNKLLELPLNEFLQFGVYTQRISKTMIDLLKERMNLELSA